MFPPGPWDVEVSRQNMLEGRRQDLRKVWDSLQAGDSEWKVEWSSKRRTTIFKGEGADDGWDWMEQMLDLSEEEFVAQVREELEDEEEGEDEGEEIA